MKKKTKLIGSIAAICLSVCMLLVGVLAANSVSLDVSSTITFSSSGVYVMATGQIYRGSSSNLTESDKLLETDRPANDIGENVSYSYNGYSYTPIGSGSDVNAPDGSISKNLNDWEVGMIEFLESESVVKYELTFKNYGETNVEITITGIQDNLENISMDATDLPITLASGETKTYSLTLTLTAFNTSFELEPLNFSVNMEKTEPSNTVMCHYTSEGFPTPYSFTIYQDDVELITLNTSINGDGTLLAEGSFEVEIGAKLTINETNNEGTGERVSGNPCVKIYDSEGNVVIDFNPNFTGTTYKDGLNYYIVDSALTMECFNSAIVLIQDSEIDDSHGNFQYNFYQDGNLVAVLDQNYKDLNYSGQYYLDNIKANKELTIEKVGEGDVYLRIDFYGDGGEPLEIIKEGLGSVEYPLIIEEGITIWLTYEMP